MSRALLLDASFSAVPIYEALIAMDFEVHVIGNRPADPLAARCNHYIQADYSDLAVLERVLCETSFESVIPGCNDLSYEMCCSIGHGRFPGLESSESLMTLHKKNEFRALTARLDLSSPASYQSIDHAIGSGEAIMVKPADAFSGRGITKLLEPDVASLRVAADLAKQHSPSGQTILEQYVEGELYSFSAFIRDGKVAQAFSVAEFSSKNPFVVDTSYVMADNPREASLVTDVERIATETGISSGLCHLQYIANGDGYWLIEMTRRCPGDLYSVLINLSTGYSYAQAYVSGFVGAGLPSAKDLSGEHFVRHTVTGNRSGSLSSLSFTADCALESWFPLATTGQRLEPSPNGRVGIAFMNPVDSIARDELVERLLAGQVVNLKYAGGDAYHYRDSGV